MYCYNGYWKKKKKNYFAQIDAGQKIRLVQDVIKTDKISKQDDYDITAEQLKATMDAKKDC